MYNYSQIKSGVQEGVQIGISVVMGVQGLISPVKIRLHRHFVP